MKRWTLWAAPADPKDPLAVKFAMEYNVHPEQFHFQFSAKLAAYFYSKNLKLPVSFTISDRRHPSS